MSLDQVSPVSSVDRVRSAVPRMNWSARVARGQLLKVLKNLRHGRLWLHQGDETFVCGTPGEDGLEVRIHIRDPRVYHRMMSAGSLGAAESYLQGEWDCNDLVGLFRLLCRNMDRLLDLETGLARFASVFARAGHWAKRNSRSGSQRNIAAHYDLSNDFFQLFLDETLMYSSAYFRDAGMPLAEASRAKLDLICRKLGLSPGMRVVEIGTGWGGFAEHAVTKYGCHVTTTTISSEQHAHARKRFERAGISNRVELLKSDYRDLSGVYDRLVSIEMIEAVGQQYLPQFFATCERLVKPGGQMLVQSILMPDHRYDRYCNSVDFIQKYIFPGGHLPSVSAVQQALGAKSQLRLTGYEEFGHSYALTLRAWRKAFFERIDEVRALGFDERFIRMWDYYLCYCEGAFLENATNVAQFVWKKSSY